MGDHITSRVFRCALATTFALVVLTATSYANVIATTATDNSPVVKATDTTDLGDAPKLTPKSVATTLAKPASSSKAPWYSFSRLKALIPNESKLLSWLPSFKKTEPSILTLTKPPAPAKSSVKPRALNASNLAKTTTGTNNPGTRVVSAEFVSPPPIPAPEPSSWLVLGLGAAGLGIWARRRRAIGTTVRT